GIKKVASGQVHGARHGFFHDVLADAFSPAAIESPLCKKIASGVDRREFLVNRLFGRIGHGGIADLGPRRSPPTPRVSKPGKSGYRARTGAFRPYRAMPKSGKSFPVVLVVQEIFGVHEQRNWAIWSWRRSSTHGRATFRSSRTCKT